MSLLEDGFEIIEDVLTSEEVDELATLLPTSSAGLRNVLHRCAAVRRVAHHARIAALLEQLGCADVQPVRALFFDKNPAHNWKVPWHQDLSIAVAERVDTPGFKAWSMKAGVTHVQPPAEFMTRMVALRFHLDDCAEGDGPLRVIPGSHRHGRIAADALSRFTSFTEISCQVRRGGVVAIRPLILHASSPSVRPRHRRVVHIEYSPDQLPDGLAWFENASPSLKALSPSA